MRQLVILATLAVVGCKSEPAPVAPTKIVPAAPSDAASADAIVTVLPGCNDAHDCQLRDVCGCTCEGVLASEPTSVDCDKSCPPHHVCDNFTLICDLAMHRCGAIPRAH